MHLGLGSYYSCISTNARLPHSCRSSTHSRILLPSGLFQVARARCSMARNRTEVKQLYQQQQVRSVRPQSSMHLGLGSFLSCISTNARLPHSCRSSTHSRILLRSGRSQVARARCSMARNRTEVKQLYQQQQVRSVRPQRSMHLKLGTFLSCISTNARLPHSCRSSTHSRILLPF